MNKAIKSTLALLLEKEVKNSEVVLPKELPISEVSKEAQLTTILDSIKHVYDLQAQSNEAIQHVLVACNWYAFTSKDVSPFKQLFTSVKGADRSTLLKYMHAYTLVKFDKAGEVTLNVGRNKAWVKDMVTLEQMKNAMPNWVDFTPSVRAVIASYDIESRIQAVINSANEKIASHETVKNIELLSFVKNAVEQFHSLQREKLLASAKVDETQLVTGKQGTVIAPSIEREEA